MLLSKENLSKIDAKVALEIPSKNIVELPEKVIQFGTGVLLRGLVDDSIDKANKQDLFNGRIVVIKSTSQGDNSVFNNQDNLFTICTKGVENGQIIEKFIINSSISRVLTAQNQWNDILALAKSPQIQIVVSNTTEVGIVLNEKDTITDGVPESFPAKLTALLLERFNFFQGQKDTGLVIIPTELISENGTKLKEIVIKLAEINQLGNEFIQWINEENDFCNSLVDRIVPGKLKVEEKAKIEELIGYQDDLMIETEAYKLWAIETQKEKTKEILSFAKADKGVKVTNDIYLFRELKIRLLNGTHTLSCGIACLLGFPTVKSAMDDPKMSKFIEKLMFVEISNAISSDKIPLSEAQNFSKEVLDRFRNPFIEHLWVNITLQYSTKMAMRNLPTLKQFALKKEAIAPLFLFSWAAFIQYLKPEKNTEGQFVRYIDGKSFIIQDDNATFFSSLLKISDVKAYTTAILSNKTIWGEDLSLNTELLDGIVLILQEFEEKGFRQVFEKLDIFNQ
jgi:tagaturonate reductase